jgi:hypothetical protein
MSIDDVINELRSLDQQKVELKRLPTEAEVDATEMALGVSFHPDYRQFLLQASNISYGIIEPATVTETPTHTNIIWVAESAWSLMNVPRDLLPICEDNGDYFCMNAIGEVIYWSHNGSTNEKWPDLATWIKKVWIARE